MSDSAYESLPLHCTPPRVGSLRSTASTTSPVAMPPPLATSTPKAKERLFDKKTHKAQKSDVSVGVVSSQ